MLESLRRGLPRIIALALLGILNLLASQLPELTGWTGGPLPFLCPLALGTGLVLLALAAGDLACRMLQPKVDPQALATDARIHGNTASAIVYAFNTLLRIAILVFMVTAPRWASAATPPAAALPLLPVLKAQQLAYWPDVPLASTLGAQVEQETCPSLRSAKCWNPATQLRTSREQGLGLGQLTRTWRADGTPRFDALAEIRAAFPKELAGLSWESRDPVLQLRALVLKDRQGFLQVKAAATPLDRLAMAFSAYNGGIGGVASDRRTCAATTGCDPGKWFGNVERTSLKAKAAIPGYGQSFFDTNRGYVRAVMLTRRVRYLLLDA